MEGQHKFSPVIAANIKQTAMTVGATTPADSFSYASIPEPTSGLLLLLGVAGLALKRRRA